MLYLMNLAHEKNITFNQLCNQILREQIEKFDKVENVKKNKRSRK